MDSHEKIEHLWAQRTLVEKQEPWVEFRLQLVLHKSSQDSPETREAGLMQRHEI